MRYSATCHKCKKVFASRTDGQPYTSQGAAEQALRMHVARIHDKTILTPTGPMKVRRQNLVLAGSGPSNVVESFAERPNPRSKLSPEQIEGVLNFIRTRRGEFGNKAACFTAALADNDASGLISNNSTAVNRYFAKAETAPVELNGGVKPKRKYTKKQKVSHVEDGIETMHWCPKCGLNLQALATAMTVAAATSRH